MARKHNQVTPAWVSCHSTDHWSSVEVAAREATLLQGWTTQFLFPSCAEFDMHSLRVSRGHSAEPLHALAEHRLNSEVQAESARADLSDSGEHSVVVALRTLNRLL